MCVRMDCYHCVCDLFAGSSACALISTLLWGSKPFMLGSIHRCLFSYGSSSVGLLLPVEAVGWWVGCGGGRAKGSCPKVSRRL